VSRWIVMCRVSGGVTGTREGVLKHLGATRYFEDADEAHAEAARLRVSMNASRFGGASYQYWAVPCDGDGGAR